jgi:acyl-CoA hydrolase
MNHVDPVPHNAIALLDRPGRAAKTMAASRRELSRVVWRSNENVFGSGRGTLILELVDDAGWATAAQHSDGHAVTVAVDHMTFSSPVWPGDVVVATAQVEGTGNTSMDIGVYVSAQRRHGGCGEPEPVAEAHLVFVAVDEHGTPRPVPAVRPETAKERARCAAAAVRAEHRQAMRTALRALPGPRS